MPSRPRCAECGTDLPGDASCRDLFHEMLALEAQVPGGPTALAHFFAVASYNLQHPSLFEPAAITGLHASLRDALEGRADIAELRRRASRAYDGKARVLRRGDVAATRPQGWPTVWPMTVRDVCRIDPSQYNTQARVWAQSVAAALAAVHPAKPVPGA